MDINALLAQVLDITSSLNPRIAIILFLLCAVGEIGFTLPYILETLWLLAGYQLAQGQLSTLELAYLWIIAQAGRQTGSLVLYYSSVLGMVPLKKVYIKYIQSRLPRRQIIPSGIMKQLNNPSPFSVAAARLVGLRIPMAMTMGAKQKLSHLVLGVLLSSVIWDGLYLILGRTVGAAVVPHPLSMLLYSLVGLTLLYLITVGVRYLLHRRSPKSKPIELK